MNVKLCDFGYSRTIFSTQAVHEIGTVQYAAPECIGLNKKTMSEKGDSFSFGVILWELITHKIPWRDLLMEPGRTLLDISGLVEEGERLDIPKECPKLVTDFIQLCWRHSIYC